MAFYKETEDSIFRELNDQFRFATHIVRMRNMPKFNNNPTMQDLMIACWVTNLVRLNTFFDEKDYPLNSIKRFIDLAFQSENITNEEYKQQKMSLKNIYESDDFEQFRKVRNSVIAHWSRKNLPNHTPFSPDQIASEVVKIFEKCGGRKVSMKNIFSDVSNDWKMLLSDIGKMFRSHPEIKI